MSTPNKVTGLVAFATAIVAFASGWAVRAALPPRQNQAAAPTPRFSHEERVLAARVLVAINKRRPGVVTPPDIVRLAASQLPTDLGV
jgi:hypothetical protein